jgi:hypothetical protein
VDAAFQAAEAKGLAKNGAAPELLGDVRPSRNGPHASEHADARHHAIGVLEILIVPSALRACSTAKPS